MSFRAIRRHALLFSICVVVVPAACLGVALAKTKEYTATSALLFRDPGFDQMLFGTSSFQQNRDSDREAATDLKLVSVSTVADTTARRLKLTRDYVKNH